MSLRPLLAAGLGLAALLLQPLARADDAPVNCPLDVSAAAVLPGVPLAHLAGGRLLVGSAANSFAPWSDLRYRSVLAQQFAMLVPENEMKWKFIHPQQDRYDFRYADCLVHFAQQHGMKVMGGPLVWHFQQSPWLDTLDLDHDGYVALLRDHIRSVIGHFRERFPGVVTQWEVVNEPISNETCAKTLKCGLRSYFWSRKLGAEYINLAFKFAREADPQAQLLLNET
ncbi:MAG TPA: endo-1,4-beta-xylanase, partial [Nevskiaceae bacterium]|nr:endo-1,4-beta-xylanase [Nevskiaceae bacterium]